MNTLQGDGDERRKSVELAALLGNQQHPGVVRFDHQHTAVSRRGFERQIEHRTGRQGIGADAGGFAAIEGPLRDAGVDAQRTTRLLLRRVQLFVFVGKKNAPWHELHP